jgi:hypothetical protein
MWHLVAASVRSPHLDKPDHPEKDKEALLQQSTKSVQKTDEDSLSNIPLNTPTPSNSPTPSTPPPPPPKPPLWEHPVITGVISGTVSGILVIEFTPVIPVWNTWIAQNASVLIVGGLAGVVVGGLSVYAAVVKSKKR